MMESVKAHTAEMIEGPEAFTRFQNAMKAVLAVPHSEIQKRIEEHRKQAAANPNRPGPKPRQKRKAVKPSA